MHLPEGLPQSCVLTFEKRLRVENEGAQLPSQQFCDISRWSASLPKAIKIALRRMGNSITSGLIQRSIIRSNRPCGQQNPEWMARSGPGVAADGGRRTSVILVPNHYK